ncbi:MAG: class II aldolase/adducin family protein [Phenylobacterium sp.]|uniref:class II aldolase/adducin family protein n=1 Tax=Phenylobacterium sp. TaxID=1871053 RepID=UPI0027363F6F|nr:class II aldolase/adducin family protein [Phenylobacterium sp.]MDP3173559.1 class II aldolase/adducin family protein [Phenylobacterium sp.]
MAVALNNRTSIYQPEQAGLIFPELPRFNDVGQERRHRKERLVAACRAFAAQGYDYGFAGHLTVRDPEHPDLYWTNPMCVHFADVTMSTLILADHEGTVQEGKYAINRAGFVLHAAVHELNPKVMAMCHAHTLHGAAWCSLGRPLDPISQDACAFFENHVVIAESAGAVAVEEESGHEVALAFGDNRAALHQNHGLLTASHHSIDDAAWWFIALEQCCRAQLLAEATGSKLTLVSPERARYSREHVGSEFIGWLHFQPIYDRIARTQPDMFH